ncbi:MAG: BrnT family toxin [Sphingomonas sp.]|uniref:BrnT family toxin n=1 Tax=Sphingomonas sp. TaxID=28214 RepID=UPI002272B5F5|nr:BrnT family toxin [Sphingomonas sp.]MCX8478058.1 BrnT family toxin [Sphingomonas sp.]
MEITYDPAKRERTLAERGLDFADAPRVFAGITLTLQDDRQDYGETRWQTYGLLDDRLVTLIWTERGQARQIISMRKCNERERARYEAQLGRSG